MKLDEDCVRDILFVTEKYSNFDFPIRDATYFNELKQKYNQQKILYHIRQCDLSGLIYGFNKDFEGLFVKDLTPSGHNFLGHIRKDENWRKTKEIARKVGATSLDVFIKVASNFVSDLISKQFDR